MLWNNGDFERTDSASGFLILIYNHWANTADSSLSPSPSPVISLIKSWASHILPFTLPNQEHLFFNDFFPHPPNLNQILESGLSVINAFWFFASSFFLLNNYLHQMPE